jgi:16S rRNA (cytidine1402-2'-O)-methyltransferase
MTNFYIIATPIGNYDDITLRAIKILNEIDFIVCEQENEYKKLLSKLNIKEKKFILCNEHDENEAIELAIPLLKNNEKGALISDCGTPLFEDPGFKFLTALRNAGFSITSLPGANSLITALSLSPFKINEFYYAGFLPKKEEERNKYFLNLLKRKETIIIIEAPYRLKNMLNMLKKFCTSRKIFLPYNLTLPDEKLFYGHPDEVESEIIRNNINKGEFFIFIEEKK